jgi:hypothetical protein
MQTARFPSFSSRSGCDASIRPHIRTSFLRAYRCHAFISFIADRLSPFVVVFSCDGAHRLRCSSMSSLSHAAATVCRSVSLSVISIAAILSRRISETICRLCAVDTREPKVYSRDKLQPSPLSNNVVRDYRRLL